MASVSVEHLLLFIASLLVATTVAGTFTGAVGRVSQALSDRGQQMQAEIRHDFAIISENGTGSCVYNCSGEGNLTLLVKNTGAGQLPTAQDRIEVLIDGRYQPAEDMSVTVVGTATEWWPGGVVRVSISKPVAEGDHRVTLIVDDDSDTFLFRIP